MIKLFHFRPFSLVAIAAFLLTVAPPSQAPGVLDAAKRAAAADEKASESVPLAIITAASADRLLNDVYATFKTAGKPEMIKVIKDLLGNVDDMKGMDRTKPFGMLLYLNPGIPPTPSPVGFFPVKNIRDLLKTIAGTQAITLKPIKDKKNRYELIGPNRSFQVLLKNGYAFIGNDEDTLDREFPDPAKIAAPLAARYDLAASANLNSIPKVTRELFATLLRGYSEAEMQQRDSEPNDAYEARKAGAMRDLEFVEGLLLDGESLTIGLDASRTKEKIVVEVALEARAKSKFGKLLKDIGGTNSTFASVLSAKAPFSMSVSTNLRKSERKAAVRSLRLAESRVSQGLSRATKNLTEENAKKAPPKDDEKPKADKKEDEKPEVVENSDVTKIVDSLVATVNKGHADFFLQFVGAPPQSFALVGGLKIEDGRKLASGLTGVLRQIKALKIERMPSITLNASTYKNVSFHRITLSEVPPQMQRVFGAVPSFLFGAGSNTFWLAIGGNNAVPALRKAMDAAGDRSKVGNKKTSTAPIQLAVNMSDWFALIGNDDGGRPRPVRDLAAKAFAKGGDDLRVEMRTTDNGLRVKATFGAGFIRFIGMGIHAQFERSQQNDTP